MKDENLQETELARLNDMLEKKDQELEDIRRIILDGRRRITILGYELAKLIQARKDLRKRTGGLK